MQHGFGVGIGGVGRGAGGGGGGGGYSGGGGGKVVFWTTDGGGGGGGSYIGPDGDWAQNAPLYNLAADNKAGYIIYPGHLMKFPVSPPVMTRLGGAPGKVGENRQLKLEFVLPSGSRRDITRDFATTWSVESGLITVDQYGVAVALGNCGKVLAVYDTKYIFGFAETFICGDSIAMPSSCMATFLNRAGTDYKFVYSFGVVSAPTFKDGGEVGEIWFSSKADNGGNFNHPPMKIWVNTDDIRDFE